MTRTATKSPRKPMAADADYFELVKRFPVRPLKSVGEHREAGTLLDELIGKDLSAGQRDYVAALARSTLAMAKASCCSRVNLYLAAQSSPKVPIERPGW